MEIVATAINICLAFLKSEDRFRTSKNVMENIINAGNKRNKLEKR